MKITLAHGAVLKLSFPAACTGYVAKTIEVDAEDIRSMARLAFQSPNEFQLCMGQLAARFHAKDIP